MVDGTYGKKAALFTKRSIIIFIMGALAIILAVSIFSHLGSNKASITIKSSLEAANSADYKLIASIHPSDMSVTVNGKKVQLNKQGQLEASLPLAFGDNAFSLVAAKGTITEHRTIVIHRNTPAESAKNSKATPKDQNPQTTNKADNGGFVAWLSKQIASAKAMATKMASHRDAQKADGAKQMAAEKDALAKAKAAADKAIEERNKEKSPAISSPSVPSPTPILN